LSSYPKIEMRRRRGAVVAAIACVGVLALPAAPSGANGGGIGPGDPPAPTTKGKKAKLKNGYAIAPASAPRKVKAAIDAANEIVKGKGYCLGGGHQKWKSKCYDCSGTVSYAIGKPGAKLLDYALPSGDLEGWGRKGEGKWITVYANGGHTFVEIAGLRLDTSQTAGSGPGWSENVRAGMSNGPFKVRHWRGL
jgi:hypothetical protein